MDNIDHFEPPGPSRVTQIMLFKQVWLYSNKKSMVSGLFLREYMGSDLFLNCFAHVLAKGMNQYPHFKHYAKNIALLTPGEHSLLDQGTEEARISYALDLKSGGWEALYELRDELKKEYKKYFPTTRGMLIGYKYDLDEVGKIVGKLNKKYWAEQAALKKGG